MRKLIVAVVALLMLIPLTADDKPLSLPSDLLSGSFGIDFELNDVFVGTLGIISIYDIVELRLGVGGSPDLYNCWALGADVDIPKLTRGKVVYALPINAKLGIYWLPERVEKEDGSKSLVNHGGITLSLVKAL